MSPAGESHGSAAARSHGSQCDQSSHGVCSVSPSNRLRNPEQSMNRSPVTVSPDSRWSAVTSPVSGCCSTRTPLPSVRTVPRETEESRRYGGSEERRVGKEWVRQFRSGWLAYHKKNKKIQIEIEL